DVGLARPPVGVDFTLAGARASRDVAEAVGLSTAATDVVRNAITLQQQPRLTVSDGAVAYLLSAGAALDATGDQSWVLPPGRPAAGGASAAPSSPHRSLGVDMTEPRPAAGRHTEHHAGHHTESHTDRHIAPRAGHHAVPRQEAPADVSPDEGARRSWAVLAVAL